MESSFDVRELGSWKLSASLASVQCALLLYSATLPQHGDSAIGTAMVWALVAALFAFQLVGVTPVLLKRAIGAGHDFGTSADLWLFGPLAAGPLCLVAVFAITSAGA
jgi:hypothetical protein